MSAFRYQHGDRPLDGYEVQQGIGRGGFGEVYFAISDSGRQVALKVLQNYEDVELRGIGHCMNLKSPHLVTIFDVRQNDQGQFFVIMEYVAGPSLRDILDETSGGLGIAKTAFFIREIAKGLTYLHDNGVVHRDLKPHNVFFEDGIVKIGDYSLSKLMTASHRSGHTMTVGTVHYMAPEISMGKYDSRVDIYALGVMSYELLTGQPPFLGESMGEILMKHMTSSPDLSMLQEPFRSSIGKALAKDPDDRYQTTQAMVEDVYGIEHVQNSVTAFNPKELSVVADRVGKKALISAGNMDSAAPINLSPGLAPTDYHDSNQRGQERPAVELAEVVESKVRTQPQIDQDPLSFQMRVAVAAVACGLIAMFGAVAYSIFFGFPVLSAFVSLFVPIMLVSYGVSQVYKTSVVPNQLSSIVVFLFLSCFILMVGSIPGHMTAFFKNSAVNQSYFGSLVLLSFFNWRALTDCKRKKRIALDVVILATFAGFLVSFISGFEFISMAIAGGIALGIQVFSDCHIEKKNKLRRNHRAKQAAISKQAVEVSPHGRWTLLGFALIFFPFLVGGLQRFRVGKKSSGTVWLLTLGLAAIGQIYDIILILTGNFYDIEGRRVLKWEDEGSKPTPVNHLSAIPARPNPFLENSKQLQRIGYGSFIAGGLIPILTMIFSILIATGIAKDWDPGFEDLSATGAAFTTFGVGWPEMFQMMMSFVSIPILGLGVGSLFLLRRHQGGLHILRVFIAFIFVLGANWSLCGGMFTVDWASVYVAISDSSLRAFFHIIQSGFVPCVAGSLVLILLSTMLLIWPARNSEFEPESVANQEN